MISMYRNVRISTFYYTTYFPVLTGGDKNRRLCFAPRKGVEPSDNGYLMLGLG